jgi:NADH-quinone oxidoreductase subunit M
MSELHLPWLEVAILCPLVGASFAARFRDSDDARKWCLWFSALTLVCAVGSWLDFQAMNVHEAGDRGHFLSRLAGREVLVVDQLSAPLLPLVALLYLLTSIATVRTKLRRFSFPLSLISEALVLATYSCRIPWAVVALLSAGTIIPFLELRARGKPARVYCLHMGLFVALLVVGQWLVDQSGPHEHPSTWALLPLIVAVVIRSGIMPFHCWVSDLFEQATFGAALLFVTPMVGAYAAIRLLLPVAPDGVLRALVLVALSMALYGAGMALIQREARRFFCYLFLSNSALVLVGLNMVSPNGLTGGLCVWLSVGLSLCGLGLTLRALEARRGRLLMREFQGLYEHTPNLAMCFGLTGLAAVGFPGTFGFVGTEILVDGAVEA